MSERFMKKDISIVDVAEEAGVSIATVSNVINQKGRVSEKTRKKIQQIIDRLGYTPNLTARNLKTRRSDLIGMVIPVMKPGRMQDNPFYWDLLAGVEEGARDRRFHIILMGIDEATETFSFVKERQLDGLIVVGTNQGSQVIERVNKLNIPVVFVDSYLTDEQFYQVCLEDRHGSYCATKYLIELGHRKIAILTGEVPEEQLSYYGVLHERWLGYKDALAEAGIAYDSRMVIQLPTSLDGGYHSVDRILQLDDVTAIFSFSDVGAMGVLKRMKELGKKVPEEYSVIGFDNLFISNYTSPTLTTVAQDIVQKGKAAVTMLLDQIDGNYIPQRKVSLSVDVIARETTGPCKS